MKQRLDDRKWTTAAGKAYRVTIDLDADKLRASKSLTQIVNRAVKHKKGTATGMYGSITVQVTEL